MTTKQKLTPWFPGDVKPVRIGVYEAEWDYGDGDITTYFNHFDGQHWHSGWFDLTSVRPSDPRIGRTSGGDFPKNWRGLSSNPKAKV